MSIEAMAVVLHHSRATGTDKLVLLGIANHEGDGGAYPSIATLARYANVGERGVQKCITRLVELGEITVHLQDGGQRDGRYRTNRYEIHVRCPEGCDGSYNHRLRGERTDTPDDSGVNAGTVRDERTDVSGVSARTPEPSLNRPVEPDDDTRENNSRLRAVDNRSSSSIDSAIRLCAEVLAFVKSRDKDTGYVRGIEINLRDERRREFEQLLEQGQTLQQVVEKLSGHPTPTRVYMSRHGYDVIAPADWQIGRTA